MKDRVIKLLDGGELFIRNRVKAKPTPLNKYDIEALTDIAKVCDEAARMLEKALIPPCKAGQIVYVAMESPKPQVERKIIKWVAYGIIDDQVIFTDDTCFTVWHKDWGLYNRAVFPTEEEAEQALKGGTE